MFEVVVIVFMVIILAGMLIIMAEMIKLFDDIKYKVLHIDYIDDKLSAIINIMIDRYKFDVKQDKTCETCKSDSNLALYSCVACKRYTSERDDNWEAKE